jgi:Zn-dependent M28 family amino/carboxypeptidase
MINLDGAGRAGESPAIFTEGCPEIVSALKELAANMKYDLPLGSRLGSHSDFFPFFLKGVPSASLVSSRPRGIEGRGFSHTSADTPDKVKLRPLREAAMVVSRFIFRVANLDSIPAKRKSSEEVKELIKLYGLEENILVSKKRTVDQLINEGIFATPLKQKEGYLNTLFKSQSV